MLMMQMLKPRFTKTKDQMKAVCLMGGEATDILLFGGSRSGKTAITVRQIILRAIKAPCSRHCILRKHQSDIRRSIVFDTFPKVMKLCFPEISYDEGLNLTYPYFRFPNGSEIWFGGLDKGDKILGNEYASIYFNEISEMSYEQIETASSRLAQKCPKIENKIYYDCNPPSKQHWSYKLFIEGKNPLENIKLNNPNAFASMRLNPDGNAHNLADGYLNRLSNMSEKKRKRFRDGEWGDDNENALWKRAEHINPFRASKLPENIKRYVAAIDPAISSKQTSDETGIILVGKSLDDHYYVIRDSSLIAKPSIWAKTAINLYKEYKADRIIGEINQGGEMVESTLRTVDKNVSYKSIRATRGKILRAEPIQALYEQGKVHHYGEFPELEEEMCNYTGEAGEISPNRLDALVYGLAELAGIDVNTTFFF
jgi:PBSX family phage terminase large subunit